MKKFTGVCSALAACVLAVGVLAGCDNEKDSPIPEPDTATDLTADGGYANSFLVSRAGEFKFAAKKVDGSDVGGIAKADWLWSSVPGEGAACLLSDVSYDAGYIRFAVTEWGGEMH